MLRVRDWGLQRENMPVELMPTSSSAGSNPRQALLVSQGSEEQLLHTASSPVSGSLAPVVDFQILSSSCPTAESKPIILEWLKSKRNHDSVTFQKWSKTSATHTNIEKVLPKHSYLILTSKWSNVLCSDHHKLLCVFVHAFFCSLSKVASLCKYMF